MMTLFTEAMLSPEENTTVITAKNKLLALI
jgi:hypothetical protein